MLTNILFVNLRFLLRTLGQAFPLAAKLVVNQVIRGKVFPFAMGIFLDDLLHELIVNRAPGIGVHLARRWTGHHLRLLQLPANVGRAPHGFPSQRRVREKFLHAVVETHRILGRALSAAPLFRLLFRISGFSVNNLVPIGRGSSDYVLGGQPTCDLADLFLLPVHDGGKYLDPGVVVHVGPLQDHQIAPPFPAQQFFRVGTGQHIKRSVMDAGTVLVVRRCRGAQREGNENQENIFLHGPPHTVPISISKNNWGSILPPLTTATILSDAGISAAWNNDAAVVTAPLGSAKMRAENRRCRMACRISCSFTVIIASTYLRMCSKLMGPMLCERSPSHKVLAALSAVMDSILPALRLACASAANSGSTPMIFTVGLDSFRAVAMPLIRPPPPMGTRTTSTSGMSSRRSEERRVGK